MSLCARPDCQTAAKSSCSGCDREQYCGSVCQKLDWKVHKLICPILKRLPNKQQRYNETSRIIVEILTSNKLSNDVRVLEHLLSYADYQFGQPVTGRNYRERSDGQRIDNWDVDICILLRINSMIRNLYITNLLLSTIIRDNKIYPHLERSLIILRPWMVTIDSDVTNQSTVLNFKQTNYLLLLSLQTEREMGMVVTRRNQHDVAEGHCHRSLANSRRLSVEGEEKITSIFQALRAYSNLRQHQGDFSDAVTFAEEAYNLVVDAYDPVHAQVQVAANCLINCLLQQGDLFNAERYAEQTYQNLKDIKNGIGQESDEVAMGAYNLADVIRRQDDGGLINVEKRARDLIKAEDLARECLCIRTQLHSPDHSTVGLDTQPLAQFHGPAHSAVGLGMLLLAKILYQQGKVGDRTKELLERSLSIFIRNEGPDGMNTAVVSIYMGHFYYRLAMRQSTVHTKRTQLILAKSYSQEAARIETKIHSPTHPTRVESASLLSKVLNELSSI